VHRQEKLALHPVHLGLVIPALCSIGYSNCLFELFQSVLRLLQFAVRIRQQGQTHG
jgi:hypothetical protein